MPFPAHARYGERHPFGMVYPVRDSRALGWAGRVVHYTSGKVIAEVAGPQGSRQVTARNVPEGMQWVHSWISRAIQQQMRVDSSNMTLARKYPVVCPKCAAPVGQPCQSAKGNNLSKTHVARDNARSEEH